MCNSLPQFPKVRFVSSLSNAEGVAVMFPSASDVRLWHVNNATVGGYTSSVTYGATANIAEGNFDAACRFPLQGEG